MTKEQYPELLAYLAQHGEKIWYATNGEIMEYVQAWRRLEYSGRRFLYTFLGIYQNLPGKLPER